MKVSIFLDFWNFSLSLKTIDPAYRPDWFAIPMVFIRQAAAICSDSTLELQDFHIFGSFSNTPADQKLKNWSRSFLPKIPGSNLHFKERQQKSTGPVCTVCHREITACPFCGGTMLGTEEKCIDTLLATTMLQDAWMKKYDVAILVSSDKDFIPAVDFLRSVGTKTIHAQFKNQGMELSKHCWGRFDILQNMDELKRL